MVFVGYHHLGYDLYIHSAVDAAGAEVDTVDRVFAPEYKPSYLAADALYIDPYVPRPGHDYLVLLGGATGSSYGWAATAYAQFGVSDYLGHHRLAAAGEYAWFGKENRSANIDVGYYYSRYRPQFGLGVFTQSSPYGVYSLQPLNDLIHRVYSDTITVRRYGGYLGAAYPFTRLLRSSLEMTSYRYERDYEDDGGRLDVAANMNQFSLGGGF
jgi:hypothetical protein